MGDACGGFHSHVPLVVPCSSFGSSAMFQRWVFVSLWSGLNVFRKPCASYSFSFPHSAMPWVCSLKGFCSHVPAVVLRVSSGLRPRCFSRCFRSHVPATGLHVNLCFTHRWLHLINLFDSLGMLIFSGGHCCSSHYRWCRGRCRLH